jgi:parallel beta-helix repeat protein
MPKYFPNSKSLRAFASSWFIFSAALTAAAAQTPATINIRDAGAIPDGKTLNTKIIQKAIDDLAAKGGGTIIIPAAVPPAPDAPKPVPQTAADANAGKIVDGAFLSGALFLKPGVNLHLDKGAILKGSTDTKDYPTMKTRIEGHFQDWLPALINAEEIDHLKIDGDGVLDGSGTPFYAAFRRDRGTNLGTPRPRLLFISKCKDASISGLHLFNSGFWNLHLYNCDGVTIDGLEIDAPRGSPSTDGIDVDSSRNVTIKNTSVSNNDDCIAIKGSKGVDALDDKDSPPDEHIHVTNCLFKMGGSVVTCGSEATFVRDVTVDHCTVAGPNSGGISVLRLKLRTDTPQTYEDIHFSDITLDGVGTLISVAPWTQYETIPPGRQRPAHTVRNISLTNIHGTFGNFGSIAPTNNPTGDTIENLTLKDIELTLRTPTPNFRGIKALKVENVKINGNDYLPNPALTQPAASAPAAQQ